MRFLLVYIKNNLRRRKSGILIPLFSFFLSALLICVTVFYLTLEKHVQEDRLSCPGFDLCITVDAESVSSVQTTFAKKDWLILRAKLEFTDLMPLYREEIAEFDDAPVHQTLPMTYIRPDSVIAELLLEHGLDAAALPSDAVYVSPYVMYYFQNHIKDGQLIFGDAAAADGKEIRLKIAGIMEPAVSEFLGAFLVTSHAEVYEAVKESAQNTFGILYYEIPDKQQADIVGRRVAEEGPPEVDLSIRMLSGWQAKESGAIYSGDAAIAVFNFFFAALCMFCTLKLKFDAEAPDYRRMRQLGLSPFHRALLPVIELVGLGAVSYVIALTAAVGLFRMIAPYEDRTGVQSRIYSYYFEPDARRIGLTAVLFGVLFLLMLGVTVYRYILRTPRAYHSYVKQSARLYYQSRLFSLPYIALRIGRHRLYNLFFIFMICFPLFVSAMYGTGAVNLVSNDNGLFADAVWTVARADVTGGTPLTQQIADDLRALPGVAAVETISKTNRRYTLSSSTHTSDVELVGYSDYMARQLTPYLTQGSFEDVAGRADQIVLIDNAGQFSLGDTVVLADSGRRYTVGAILRNVPLDNRSPFALIDLGALERVTEEKLLPHELHIYLDADISASDYRSLCRMIPTVISDPHAVCDNQRDAIAVLDGNGRVVHDAASSMNLLIAVISVASVFFYHVQQNVNRRQELAILHRMGLGARKIRLLVHLESLLLLTVGLGIFALLYGGYVGGVMHAIEASQSYQYAGFSFAWREIILISLGMIGVVTLADFTAWRGGNIA